MRPFVTYQLEHYLEKQSHLQVLLKVAKLTDTKEEVMALSKELHKISTRVISARRNMRYKQDIIDGGTLGPMPEVFANGREISYCPKCRGRVDVVDMLGIQGDKWVWLSKCQKCTFEHKSGYTIAAKAKVHAATAMPDPTNRVCEVCNIDKPIEDFKILGLMVYEDQTYNYDYMCRKCRNKSASSKHIGVKLQQPYKFLDDSKRILYNKAFFHKRGDILDGSIMAQVSDAISDLNADTELCQELYKILNNNDS
jgi:hypothetical protein